MTLLTVLSYALLMTNTLNPVAVEDLFVKCLYTDDETIPDEPTITHGVMNDYALNPERLEANRELIAALLAELPDEFQSGKGGGWSFLNACMDRHGNLWTGMHPTVEKLVVLGIATGQAEFLLPREIWSVLPGGMPYFAVKSPEAF